MKGKTKIQLIDFKTGLVKEERYDNNIVTNAINNALKMILENAAKYDCSSKIENTLNLFQEHLINFFKQVVLLEDTQALTNIMAKGNVIGIASSLQLIKNTSHSSREGIFLITESGPIVDGYELTWQWGTNEGNGVINSICLMPDWTHTYGAITLPPDKFMSYISISRSSTILHDLNDDIYLVDYSGYLYKYTRIPVTLDSEKDLALTNNYESTLLNTSITSAYKGAVREFDSHLWIVDIISNVAYAKEFDKSGNLLQTITLGDANTTVGGGFDINDNYIVYCSALDETLDVATVQVYNHTGEHQRTIEIPSMPQNDIVKIFFLDDSDEFYIVSSYTYLFTVADDCYAHAKYSAATGQELYHGGYCYPDNQDYKDIITDFCDRPFKEIMLAETAYAEHGNIYTINPLMLTTINNLSSPIVKTDEEVLKITYTLLEA